MSRVGERIDVTKFITHRFPLQQVQEAFRTAVEDRERAIKVLLQMD